MRLEIPTALTITDVHSLGLPDDWRDNMASTQQIGMDRLASCSSLALLIPSFIEPRENKVLINPAHSDFAKIELTIEANPFKFDPRLYK